MFQLYPDHYDGRYHSRRNYRSFQENRQNHGYVNSREDRQNHGHVNSRHDDATRHRHEERQGTTTTQQPRGPPPSHSQLLRVPDDKKEFNNLILGVANVGRNTIAFDTRLQVLRNIRSQLTTQHTYYTAVMQRHNAILKRIQAEIEATKAKQSRTKERLDMVQRAEAHVSATRCRIFRVPLEIRRIIYEFVLAVDNDLELQDPARLQFLLTCHKFHDEAKHMAYQSQHFRVHWVTGYASGSVGPQLDTKIKRLPHGMMRDIRTLVLPLNKYGFGPGGQSRTDFEKEYLRRIFMRLGGRGYFCLSKVQVVKFYHHKRAGSERLLQITMNRTDEILDVDQSNHQHQVWQVTLHPGHLSRLSNLDYIANGRFLARLR